MHHHHILPARHLTDRHKIADDVVIQPAVQTGIDGVRGRAHEQGVAIRRCFGRYFCADVGASARAVFNHNLLLDLRRQFLRVKARDDIHTAAR